MLLVLGGLDPTGGAGLLRDWTSATAYASTLPTRCIVTAFTQQGHGQPAVVHELEAGRLRQTLQRVGTPKAVKVGMLSAQAACELAEYLSSRPEVLLVVDPVLRATDDGLLARPTDAWLQVLARASVATPNFAEACSLAGIGQPPTDGFALAGNQLSSRLRDLAPETCWLVKSWRKPGDASGPAQSGDLVFSRGHSLWLQRHQEEQLDPRGTGCALATVIAAGLARSMSSFAAIEAGVNWLRQARQRTHRGRDGAFHLGERRGADHELVE